MAVCDKKPYPTQLQATLALRAIARRARQRGRPEPTGTYLCHCRRWHLTSKSNSQKPPWAKGARRPL